MRNKKLVALAVASASLFAAACGSDDNDSAATTPTTAAAPATTEAAATTEAPTTEASAAGDIVVIASANPDFSTLVAAVAAAELVETLQSAGPFTVFAPTNAAFDALPEGLVEALLLPENKEVLTSILTYHVVSGTVMAADVTEGDVPTVQGEDIAVTIVGDSVMLNETTTVVATDIVATNGVIHVIDSVLVPPSVDVAALLEETPTTDEAAAAEDIVAIASANEDFSTLVAAVAAAGLVETLQGEGPFTVFAPTNDAFDALPAGLVEKLLLPENVEVLTQILTYHVVSGAVMAADVTEGDVPTVEGSDIAVTIVDEMVMLNETTTVTATDIVASNGVIHVIDSVLLPPGLDITPLL